MTIANASTWTGTGWRSFHANGGEAVGDTQVFDTQATWRSLNGRLNPDSNERFIWDGTAWQPLDIFVADPPTLGTIGLKYSGQGQAVPGVPLYTEPGDVILFVCYAPGTGSFGVTYPGAPPLTVVAQESNFSASIGFLATVWDGVNTQWRIDYTADSYMSCTPMRIIGSNGNPASWPDGGGWAQANTTQRYAPTVKPESESSLYLFGAADFTSANGPYTPNAGWVVAEYEPNISNYSSMLVGRRTTPGQDGDGIAANFVAAVADNYAGMIIEILPP